MFWHVFWLFLKINLLSTSGPVSIGLLHTELVGTYITNEQFVEGVGLTHMLPGSEALKLGIYFGYSLGGPGGILAGVLGALLPPSVIILALAYLLKRLHHQEWFERFAKGISPAIAVLLMSVAGRMLGAAIQRPGWPFVLGISLLSGVALVRKMPVVLVLLLAALAGAMLL